MQQDAVYIIYDGECPLCQFGVTHFRLKEGMTLELLDARAHPRHPLLQQVKDKGINLDEGMVAVIGGVFHHGAEAVHALAKIGGGDDTLNRAGNGLFRSQAITRLAYPFLKAGRRVALWAKGVPLIRNLDK